MSRKHQFLGSLVQILKRHHDGAFTTRSDREKSLKRLLKSLYEDGYQLEHVKYIKQRHVIHIVNKLKQEGASPGYIKNKMSHIRWLVEKLEKPNLVPSNDELGIPKRIYIDNVDKSRDLTQEDLEKVNAEYMQLSLRAQKFFGLRLEESLKIQAHVADQGERLYIKGSWAKGGKTRYIPILTEEQRAWLDECKSLMKHKHASLIPANITYKTYRDRFEKTCQLKGINHRHGLRHLYAQQRYQEISGMPCRVKGGLLWKEMTWEQRALDRKARMLVSQALGHERIAGITSAYLGTNRK